MNGAPAVTAVSLDQLAHLTLQLGRLLLVNGVDTDQTRQAMTRFAAAYGAEANVLVSYETVLVTLAIAEQLRTKSGHRLPGMGVGMATVELINHLVDEAAIGRIDLNTVQSRTDAIEHQPPVWPRWLIVVGLGVTAASLARLFGGDWFACVAAGLAGVAGTWLRLELGARHVDAVPSAFIVALLSGVVGGVLMRLGHSDAPALALVAPAMILVPGVPFINGVLDMIRNHVTIGLSRLAFASIVVLAIGLGIFAATLLTGIGVPVDAKAVTIAVPEDALFSALAGGGYALLFNVPLRMAWACAVCGLVSHSLRTLLFQHGVDLIAGTLLGALAAGVLAQLFARHFRAPAVAMAFPGVVAMIPGAYAFRAIFGTLHIADATANAATITETLSLSATVGLMVGAIAIGVASPALLFPRNQ